MRKHDFKKALITGATSGIGKELSTLLSQKKIALCLTGRNQKVLENLYNDLKTEVDVEILKCDLALPQERKLLVDWIHATTPDLVINNAGFGTYGPLLAYDTSYQMQMIEVMVKAVLELTMESLHALIRKERRGTILNVSSTAAFLEMPLMANYAACKAYSKSLSLALDYELHPLGIRILCSCPGVVKTGFRKTASIGERGHVALPFEMDVSYAADRIWNQIIKGKTLDIFDWKYRWMLIISKLLPKSLLHKIISSSVSKLTPENKRMPY